MKSIISIYIFLLIGFVPLTAQDLIVLLNGETLKAKVTEIRPHDLSYKLNQQLEGPTLILEKKQIFLIQYENGRKEIFQSLPSSTKTNQEPIPSSEARSKDIKYISANQGNGRAVYTARQSKQVQKDDFLVRGGYAFTFGNPYRPGPFLGLERTWYFSPNIAFASHASVTHNTFLSYNYASRTAFNTALMLGLKAQSSIGGIEGYVMPLAGYNWSTSSGFGNIWSWVIGGGAGIVLFDRLDLGGRFNYYPESNGVSMLQAGLGYHF